MLDRALALASFWWLATASLGLISTAWAWGRMGTNAAGVEHWKPTATLPFVLAAAIVLWRNTSLSGALTCLAACGAALLAHVPLALAHGHTAAGPVIDTTHGATLLLAVPVALRALVVIVAAQSRVRFARARRAAGRMAALVVTVVAISLTPAAAPGWWILWGGGGLYLSAVAAGWLLVVWSGRHG